MFPRQYRHALVASSTSIAVAALSAARSCRLRAALLLSVALCSFRHLALAAAPARTGMGGNLSALSAIAIAAASCLVLGLAVAGLLTYRFLSGQVNKLETTEERYSLLFEKSLAGIYRSDIDGGILDCNPAFVNLLGYRDKSQIIGLSLPAEILTADSRKNYFDFLLEKGSVSSCETLVYCADRSPIWVLAAGTVMQNRAGASELQGMFLSMQELKRKELELKSAKVEAECASQTKTQFLSNMSHELRTPLIGIIGMTELIEQSSHTDEHGEYLNVIRKSADSLLGLISAILEFADKSAPAAFIQIFSISSLVMEEIRSVCACSSSAAAQSSPVQRPVCAACPRHRPNPNNLSLKFENKLKPDDLYFDNSAKLRRALAPLLDNAVKFTREGEIVVTLASLGRSPRAEFLSLSVRDTGIGIAPQLHQSIFEPFSQADGSHSRRFGGTGMGLAVAREAIRSLGGEISVASELGRGSTFTIQVALALEETAEASEPIHSASSN